MLVKLKELEISIPNYVLVDVLVVIVVVLVIFRLF